MPLLPVPDGVVADRFEDRRPSTELLLLGINNETDGLGIRWSRRAVDLLFGVGYPDPWLQAKLFCPTRITSIIERQQLAAGLTGG